MKKNGKARILDIGQQENLFMVIKKHRHPEKNTAIMQISFKLGLRVQEISLLQIKEVAKILGAPGTADRQFQLYEIMSLPASYTKGADALKRSNTHYERKRIGFSVSEFDRVVQQIVDLAKAGVEVDPTRFYPEAKKHKGKSRDLPMVSEDLREALNKHIEVRLSKDPYLKQTDPLFVSQKGSAYSPNTLQEHMAMMLREWGGVEKASSHSGRRAVMHDIIHKQNKPLKIAQQIAGHVSPSTTVGYTEASEEELSMSLINVGTGSKGK